jgi:transcriptional regulator with XRE-family HTH domain
MNIHAIGDNIRLYCRMKNTTLHALADDIGVSWVTMSKWINGRRQITAYGLYRVSKVLGVSMERLMEGIEDE